MEKIKLYNRNGYNIWFEHIDENLWQLKSQHPQDLAYMRFIYEEDGNELYAVDPSGGPFLSVGTVVDEQHTIEKIFPNGFIFRLS